MEVARLLKQLRNEHDARWRSSAVRHAAQHGAKTYSVREATKILNLKRGPHAAANAPPPTDYGLLRWPVMCFYRPPFRRRGPLGAANPWTSSTDGWGGRATLLQRVRDRVHLSESADPFTLYGGHDQVEARHHVARKASGMAVDFQNQQAGKLLSKLRASHEAHG